MLSDRGSAQDAFNATIKAFMTIFGFKEGKGVDKRMIRFNFKAFEKFYKSIPFENSDNPKHKFVNAHTCEALSLLEFIQSHVQIFPCAHLQIHGTSN